MFDKAKNPLTLKDHPAYREAEVKLADLREEHTAIAREIDAAHLTRSAVPVTSSRIEDAARAYLTGAGGTAVAVASLSAIDEMVNRRNVIEEAIRLQQLKLESVRGEVSREIAKAAKPEYMEILKRMAEALVVLSDAAEAEFLFRERFIEQGISFVGTIPPCPLEEMRLNVYASKANRWLDEIARDFGIRLKVARRMQP